MFKYKPEKIKFLTKVKTLDETHQKFVNNFESQSKMLPDKRKELDDLKKQLSKLQSCKKNEEIQEKIVTLKKNIYDLVDIITKIENDEINYYSKISDILFDYYDITDTTIHCDNEESDTLTMLNELSQKTRKVKKPSKKRIKNMEDFNNRKTIFDYIKKKEPDDKSIEKINRATLLDKYNNIIYGRFGKKPFVKICTDCKIEKLLIHSEGVYVCPKCGKSESIIIESELTNYKDVGCEKTAYPYKRMNHLIECLNQFQAKESVEIPSDIFVKIMKEVKKNRFDVSDITFSKMKTILKKLRLHKYYEHIPHIISKITGKPAPIISREMEEKIKVMFRTIQEPFIRYCPVDRKNFLSYSYILHKFFEILGLYEFADYFTLLKSREKLRIQDQIWKKICYDLNYPFYPSI